MGTVIKFIDILK